MKERNLEEKRKQGKTEVSKKRTYHIPKRKKAKNTPCTCNICGTEFLGVNRCSRFCSPECRKIGESRYNKEQYKIRKSAKGVMK